MPAREVLTLNTSIPRIEVPQAGDTYVMPRDLAVSGFITEAIGGVVYPVASQFDIGTNPNQIPLNQYLGTMAYQDAEAISVGRVFSLGVVGAFRTTAIPAGGTAGTGLLVSSATNFGVFFGSGAPTLAAAKGSLYLRSDGTTTNDRAYINTDGATTWTALTTAA
jgi:hypothetical protein